jgi:hypothetical protein
VWRKKIAFTTFPRIIGFIKSSVQCTSDYGKKYFCNIYNITLKKIVCLKSQLKYIFFFEKKITFFADVLLTFLAEDFVLLIKNKPFFVLKLCYKSSN